MDKRDKEWDVFKPALKEYNEKRRALIEVMICVLDESMSGWKPKTSKTGGMPNVSFEPRKPVDLGALF